MDLLALPRDVDYDVSGSDGVRFVVIPVMVYNGRGWTGEAQAFAGWTAFDTSYKRAGRGQRQYELAVLDASILNLRDQEADAA